MSVNIASACQRGQLVSWCQFAGASGHAAVHRLCLDFIKANFGDNPRLEFLDLLGYNPDDVSKKIEDGCGVKVIIVIHS